MTMTAILRSRMTAKVSRPVLKTSSRREVGYLVQLSAVGGHNSDRPDCGIRGFTRTRIDEVVAFVPTLAPVPPRASRGRHGTATKWHRPETLHCRDCYRPGRGIGRCTKHCEVAAGIDERRRDTELSQAGQRGIGR